MYRLYQFFNIIIKIITITKCVTNGMRRRFSTRRRRIIKGEETQGDRIRRVNRDDGRHGRSFRYRNG